jgi:hypothetical protein
MLARNDPLELFELNLIFLSPQHKSSTRYSLPVRPFSQASGQHLCNKMSSSRGSDTKLLPGEVQRDSQEAPLQPKQDDFRKGQIDRAQLE